MSGKPMKKCLMCGKEDPAMGFWHRHVDHGEESYSRYSRARLKLCFHCVRDFKYAEVYLLFHEIAEAYPDNPK